VLTRTPERGEEADMRFRGRLVALLAEAAVPRPRVVTLATVTNGSRESVALQLAVLSGDPAEQ
jgi:hypothetical protein